MSLELLVALPLGLIFGSFANVVIHRLPYDQSVVKPASHCPECKTPLKFYENIPLLSYLLQRGRCRHCSKPISARYPVVEALCALLFAAIVIKFPGDPLIWVRSATFAFILLCVTFIDLDHRIIPDELSLGGTVLAILSAGMDERLVYGSIPWRYGFSIGGAALGFGIFYGFSWLYHRWTGRHGLGGGDVKLLAMIGGFTGPSGVLATLLVSSVLGSVIGLAWGAAQRKKDLRHFAVPYGPFLAVGALFFELLGDVLWFPYMTQI